MACNLFDLRRGASGCALGPGPWCCVQSGTLLLLSIFFSFLFVAPAFADAISIDQADRTVARWQATLENATKALDRVAESGNKVPDLRSDLEVIRTEAADLAVLLEPEIVRLTGEQQQLGEAPKEGEPDEAESVAALRKSLTLQITALNGIKNAAQFSASRAGGLISRLETMKRQRFIDRVLERTDSPLLPGLWIEVFKNFGASWQSARTLAVDWFARPKSPWHLPILAALIAIVYAATRFVTSRTINARRRGENVEQAFFRSAESGIKTAIARALPPLLALGVAYVGLSHLDLRPPHHCPDPECGFHRTRRRLIGLGGVDIRHCTAAPTMAPHRPN